MNIEDLASSLKPWFQVDTWSTHHPLDSKRFHNAVKSAIETHGSQMTYDDFKEAMELLSEQLYADKYEAKYLSEKIDLFASTAEHIASYIYDTTHP